MSKINYTPKQALQQFGINWGIGSAPVQWKAPPPSNRFDHNTMMPPPPTIEDLPHRVMYREDTGKPLGIVSDKYTPLDNQQFAGAVSLILNDAENTIVSGGAYRGGKSVWMSADLGTSMIAGVDPIKQYATFFTAHDGGGSLRMVATTQRVHCSNQFANLDKSGAISIRHIGDQIEFGIEAARASLIGLSQWHATLEETSNILAGQQFDASWLAEFFRRSYIASLPKDTAALLRTPVTTDMPLESVAKRERAEARLESHLEIMAGNYAEGMRYTAGSNHMPDDIRGSKWHAFNAFTHYVDHDTNRGAESVQVGAAAAVKSNAFSLAAIL